MDNEQTTLSSGDESGSLSLGPHDKSQLNVRVSDLSFHRLEALKKHFDCPYGQIVEQALADLWVSRIKLQRGLLESGDFHSLDVKIQGYEAVGNRDHALWLFNSYFGVLWDTLCEAMKRLERAGVELPLERPQPR